MAVVVFPTPPFWLTRVYMRVIRFTISDFRFWIYDWWSSSPEWYWRGVPSPPVSRIIFVINWSRYDGGKAPPSTPPTKITAKLPSYILRFRIVLGFRPAQCG